MRRPRWLHWPWWALEVGHYFGLVDLTKWPRGRREVEPPFRVIEPLDLSPMLRLLEPDPNPLLIFSQRIGTDMGALLDAIVWEWPRDTAALADRRRQRRDAASLELLALGNVASLARVVPYA